MCKREFVIVSGNKTKTVVLSNVEAQELASKCLVVAKEHYNPELLNCLVKQYNTKGGPDTDIAAYDKTYSPAIGTKVRAHMFYNVNGW